MSKGSTRRPSSITDEKFAENWDRIFNKKELTENFITKQKKALEFMASYSEEIGYHDASDQFKSILRNIEAR